MAIPKYIYCNRTLWLLFNLIFTRFIANGTGRTLMLERCVYLYSPPPEFPPRPRRTPRTDYRGTVPLSNDETLAPARRARPAARVKTVRGFIHY